MQNRPTSHRPANRLSFPLRATWLALFLCFFCGLTFAFAPAAHAQNTSFIYNNGDVLTDINDYYYRSFTITRSTTFDLRYTPDYASDCVILAPSYLNAFISGGAYRYFVGFDNRFGTKRFTLAPGTYYLAIRNEVDARNAFSCELDYALSALAPDNNGSYSFSRWGIAGSRYVAARGGILYNSFSISSNERTFLDGCNSGVETYVIARNQLSNVLNGRSFTYYTAYSGNATTLPGFVEITLPAGSYYLVFINKSSIAKAVTYQMEYWQRSNPLYLDMQAPASWSLSGDMVTVNVAKIVNTSSTTTSGSLRLSLWALQSPYTGTVNSGVNMANLDLGPLLPRYQYTDINSTLYATRPYGTYYTAFLLNEYTTSGWRVVDWINIPNPINFEAPNTRAIGRVETSSFTATGVPHPDALIAASPLPASRSTSALVSRQAVGLNSIGPVTRDSAVAAPPTNSGAVGADVLVGQGRTKAKAAPVSPNSSGGAA